jgi:hypothetical protein
VRKITVEEKVLEESESKEALQHNQETLVRERNKLQYMFRNMYDRDFVSELRKQKVDELEGTKNPHKRFFIEGYVTALDFITSNVIELEPNLRRD